MGQLVDTHNGISPLTLTPHTHVTESWLQLDASCPPLYPLELGLFVSQKNQLLWCPRSLTLTPTQQSRNPPTRSTYAPPHSPQYLLEDPNLLHLDLTWVPVGG